MCVYLRVDRRERDKERVREKREGKRGKHDLMKRQFTENQKEKITIQKDSVFVFLFKGSYM